MASSSYEAREAFQSLKSMSSTTLALPICGRTQHSDRTTYKGLTGKEELHQELRMILHERRIQSMDQTDNILGGYIGS